MEPAKIVARFTDGRVLKGYSSDFAPDRVHFHLVPAAGPADGPPRPPSGSPVEVPLPALKALFFVRDFVGDARYQERKRFDDLDGRQGRKVAVTFADGEVLVGYTVAYDPRRPGFFLYPADPRSNNLRVFAVARAVRAVASPEKPGAAGERDDARRAMVDAKLIGNLQSVVGVLRQTVSDWEGLIRAVETLTQENATLRARGDDLERGQRELDQLRQQRADDLRALVQLRSAHRTLAREHEETVRELTAIRRAYEGILQEREAAAGELEALLRRLQPS